MKDIKTIYGSIGVIIAGVLLNSSKPMLITIGIILIVLIIKKFEGGGESDER